MANIFISGKRLGQSEEICSGKGRNRKCEIVNWGQIVIFKGDKLFLSKNIPLKNYDDDEEAILFGVLEAIKIAKRTGHSIFVSNETVFPWLENRKSDSRIDVEFHIGKDEVSKKFQECGYFFCEEKDNPAHQYLN